MVFLPDDVPPACLPSCLQEQQQGSGEASSGDMLQDLATYLTLEKAQVGRAPCQLARG